MMGRILQQFYFLILQLIYKNAIAVDRNRLIENNENRVLTGSDDPCQEHDQHGCLGTP